MCYEKKGIHTHHVSAPFVRYPASRRKGARVPTSSGLGNIADVAILVNCIGRGQGIEGEKDGGESS